MKPLKCFISLCALLLAGSLSAYDIRSGLVSYYSFDVSNNADSAFTNNFTAVNNPVLATANPAPHGSVLQLNGSSQYLRLDHPTDNGTNGMPIYRAGTYSIVFWVKGAAQTAKYLFTHGNSTATPNPLFLLQTGNTAGGNSKLDILIRNDGNTTFLSHVLSASTVFDNTWHHIAWVDNNGAVKLYVDGNLDSASAIFSYTRSGTFSFDRSAVGTLIRNTVATGNIFNGAFDDLSLWERPLSQAEVQSIMTNGIANPVPALLPALFIEPVSVTKNFQDGVTFSVTAIGTRPNNVLSYQWNLNGSNILDATNRTFRILNLTTNDSGQAYSVTVSNNVGAVTSSNAILTVLADGPSAVTTGVVSYWPLDNVSTNTGVYTTIDLYSRNDLVLTNMTEASLAPGQFSNSLSFDNLANTYGRKSGGSPAYTTNSSGYSVSLWVKADGTFQSDARVYAEGSTNSNNQIFSIGTAAPVSPTGLARIYIRNDAGVELLNRNSTRTVFDNTWHHIVWVDKAGQGKLYVDGVTDETDFTYAPGPVSLNTTTVGGLFRLTFGNIVFGNIDEVATWNRPLTYTEVQDVRNLTVPAPITATPPSITVQPVGTNVFTQATVTFSVGVAGTAPFTYQWYKGGSAILNATNSTLTLSNIQLGDAGSFSLSVTNSGGGTNSQAATLTITTRPAPPASLGLDFNNRTEDAGFTEAGFNSFTLDGTSPAGSAVTTATTRIYGGVEVTAQGSSGTTIDSRRRLTPTNAGDFTQQNLLDDFIFSPPTTGTDGLDVTVRFMTPNQQYAVTLWSYDSGQTTGDRISDWYANGVLAKQAYTFNTANPPTNNAQYQFSFLATSDANGTILIQGRRNAGSGTAATVFLNALKIDAPSAPSIVGQPAGANVFVNSDVSFSVSVIGAGPFTYQWSKNNVAITGETNNVLLLPNVQLTSAGSYSVTVANVSGSTNSAAAVLAVAARPAPPVFLGIDFNDRNFETNFTQPGFGSFTLGGTGAIAGPTTHLFGGVEVTVAGSAGTTVESRNRATITNTMDFTQELLLKDFVYSVPTTGTDGLDVTLRFLDTNMLYTVTVWSFDNQNFGSRISDWTANGVLVDTYTFDGTFAPTNNTQYQFSFNIASDTNGTILLQGRRDPSGTGVAVFLNALQVSVPPTIISQIELVGGNIRLTVQTPDSSKQHIVEQTSDPSSGLWSPVSGVTTTILSPNSLQFEFSAPVGTTRFYRINRQLH
jgi:hypothetical protein